MKMYKKTGEVYTPELVVKNMLDMVSYKNKNILKKHIIDNSCGLGAFLSVIVKRYIKVSLAANISLNEIKRDLEKYIHGIELNKESHKVTISTLDEICLEHKIPGKVKWDIINGDSLHIKKYDKKMDFVVGNPPYIRIHDLDVKYKEFEFSKKGMTDLYLIFFEIGINMLNETGKLIYITPNSYLTSSSGYSLRKYLLENNLIQKVLNLGHDNPFKNITTYPIITMLKKQKKNKDVEVYKNDFIKNKYIKDFTIKNETYQIENKFYFHKSNDINFLKEILTVKSNNSKVFVRNGLATNFDSFFYNDNFEGEFIIDAIKASNLKYTKLFYPYDKSGKLIPLDEIKRKNKNIYDELQLKKFSLCDRSLENMNNWYGFARSQAIKDVYKEKITMNNIIRTIESIKIIHAPYGTAIYSGFYIYSDCISLEEIQKKLKSQKFIEYVKLLGKDKNGHYYYVSSKDVQKYLDYSFLDYEYNKIKLAIKKCDRDLNLYEKIRK